MNKKRGDTCSYYPGTCSQCSHDVFVFVGYDFDYSPAHEVVTCQRCGHPMWFIGSKQPVADGSTRLPIFSRRRG